MIYMYTCTRMNEYYLLPLNFYTQQFKMVTSEVCQDIIDTPQ